MSPDNVRMTPNVTLVRSRTILGSLWKHRKHSVIRKGSWLVTKALNHYINHARSMKTFSLYAFVCVEKYMSASWSFPQILFLTKR